MSGYRRWPGHPVILTTPWATAAFDAEVWEAARTLCFGRTDTVTISGKSASGPWILRAVRYDPTTNTNTVHEARGRTIMAAVEALRGVMADHDAIDLEDADDMAKPEGYWTS